MIINFTILKIVEKPWVICRIIELHKKRKSNDMKMLYKNTGFRRSLLLLVCFYFYLLYIFVVALAVNINWTMSIKTHVYSPRISTHKLAFAQQRRIENTLNKAPEFRVKYTGVLKEYLGIWLCLLTATEQIS